MTNFIEKRRCRRFEIPGARVKYKKTGFFGLLKDFSKELPMLNISKGGLGFLSDRRFRPGEKILMQLLIPNEASLALYARVRWQGEETASSEAATGIEFMPFGKSKGFNPIEALNLLRQLDEQYGE